MSYPLFLLLLAGVPIAVVGFLVRRWYRAGQQALAFKVAITTASVFLLLFAAELFLYLRASEQTVDNPTFVWSGNQVSTGHPNLPYRRKANLEWTGLSEGDLALLNGDRDPYAREVHYKTDKDGFRNHRQIDRADIVVLGDSYTEAGNVAEEEGYVFKLGQKTGLQTKNLGVAGYTTPHELIILRLNGLPAQPRLVILQVAESNDLPENEQFYKWVQAGHPPMEFEPLVRSRADAWKQSSPTYGLFQAFFPMQLNAYTLQGHFTDSKGERRLTRFLHAPNSNMQPAGHVGWNIMQGSLQRMTEICREDSIQLLVMMIPDKINVLRDVVDFGTAAAAELNASPVIPAEQSFAAHLAGICRRFQVPFVDMTPALQESAKAGNAVYLPLDTHLSPAGHDVVADVLTAVIGQL